MEGDQLKIYAENGASNLPRIMDEVRSAGGKMLSITVEEQSLEDVFIHYTGKSIRREEARKVSFLIGAGIPQKMGN